MRHVHLMLTFMTMIKKNAKLCMNIYESYSKINLRLVGKNKRVVIASKLTLSSKKELLFLLYAYPHTFSPRSVGVNTDRTWTLSSPLPPAVRYVLWFVFFTQKDKARPLLLLLHLVGYLYNCIRDARSQKHPICQSAIFWHYYELTLFSTFVG